MSQAMSRMSVVRLGLLGLIWGSVFLFIKVAGYAFSPVQMVFARLLLGALAEAAAAKAEPPPADHVAGLNG